MQLSFPSLFPNYLSNSRFDSIPLDPVFSGPSSCIASVDHHHLQSPTFPLTRRMYASFTHGNTLHFSLPSVHDLWFCGIRATRHRSATQCFFADKRAFAVKWKCAAETQTTGTEKQQHPYLVILPVTLPEIFSCVQWQYVPLSKRQPAVPLDR